MSAEAWEMAQSLRYCLRTSRTSGSEKYPTARLLGSFL
jgi:hypothetical protein